MSLILEINGKSIERVSIAEEGITIGRSLDNDVIIQDRFVDPKQIGLTRDKNNDLLIEDLNSVNGTEINDVLIKGSGNAYSYGDRISIGDTVLRFMQETSSVDKAVPRSFWFHLIRAFRSWPLLCILVSLVGALHVLQNWSYSTATYNLADGFSDFFSNVSGVFAIVICFAVFNKIIKGRSSFREYMVVVSFIGIVELIADFVVWILRFNWQELAIGEVLPVIVSNLVNALFVLSALSYMTQLSRYKMITLSLLFAALWTYKENAAEFGKEDYEKWSKYANIEDVVFPPSFLFTEPSSIDQHFDKSGALFKSAENE